MTEAEKELLDLVTHPDFEHCLRSSALPHTTQVAAARLKVVTERIPEGFKQELALALADARAAEARVAELGRKHPVACYGEGGLMVKLRKEAS